MPAGIRLEIDGRYAAMFSYKMKNYVLLDAAGEMTIRGSGLKSRGLERFQRLEALGHRPGVLVFRDAEPCLPGFEELLAQQVRDLEIEHVRHVADAGGRERVQRRVEQAGEDLPRENPTPRETQSKPLPCGGGASCPHHRMRGGSGNGRG